MSEACGPHLRSGADGNGWAAWAIPPAPHGLGLLSAVLGYSSVPVFENYIIQDPKGFYVWAGIVLDHSFRDSKQPLPLKVRIASLARPDGTAQPGG